MADAPVPLPPAPTKAIPSKVAAGAQSRGLGDCLVVAAGSNPIGNFLFAVGAGVVLILVAFGLSWVGEKAGLRFLAYLVFLCFVGALIAAIFSVVALLAGFTASYLYQGGLVHTKNGRVQVVAWSDLDEVWRWRAGGNTALRGKLLCYYVVTFDGRKVPIEAKSAKGSSELGERLEQTAVSLGRKVSDSGPYTGRLRP